MIPVRPALRRVARLSAPALLLAAPAQAQTVPANPWRTMAERDLAFAVATVRAQYIRAVYPDRAAFERGFAPMVAQAQAEAARIANFPGYRATLTHFVAGLDDEHVAVSFSVNQTRLFWPGFVATYVGRRYVVTASIDPALANGSAITGCDGRTMDALAAATAAYEGGHPGLESTKASAAIDVFIDRGNPFLTRPATCTIGGKPVTLDWQRIRYPAYARTVLPLAGVEDRTASIRPFGSDAAIVRLGYFEPDSPAEADAFRKVVAAAPSLRDKKAIVIDVRQNGGGPYNWFMDFLRSLYGAAYTDRYARARLEISPVYRATPEVLADYRKSDANDAALGQPQDAPRGDPSTEGVANAIKTGAPVFKLPRPAPAPTRPAPANPVKAKVYVLTDFGCASACIAFVDELKRFSGVTQIGLETFVDSRTGTPIFYPLPSGNGTFMVASMTRDGRVRGDNVPQKPSVEFTGDMTDTAQVEAWLRSVIR